MQLLCPHCRNPFELVDGALPEVILCPACGSSFRLEPDRTRSYHDQHKQLGKFQLLENVGAGAFGVLWKAPG